MDKVDSITRFIVLAGCTAAIVGIVVTVYGLWSGAFGGNWTPAGVGVGIIFTACAGTVVLASLVTIGYQLVTGGEPK